jgi:hypothetical protein
LRCVDFGDLPSQVLFDAVLSYLDESQLQAALGRPDPDDAQQSFAVIEDLFIFSADDPPFVRRVEDLLAELLPTDQGMPRRQCLGIPSLG